MELTERLIYVENLIIRAINAGDSEAVMRYHNVMYLLYKELSEEQQKQLIALRKVG